MSSLSHATTMTCLSYADTLREKLEYALVLPRPAGVELVSEATRQDDTIEPESFTAVTSIGRNAKIHPRPSPGEELPSGYSRSPSSFLVCNNILEVEVNQQAIQRESKRLQRHAVVAYFVGGCQSIANLLQWPLAVKSQIGD